MNLRYPVFFASVFVASVASSQEFDAVCTRAPDGGFLGAPFTVTYSLPVEREPEPTPLPTSDGFFTDGPGAARRGESGGNGATCSGGGFVGALNCVTTLMDGVGSGDTGAENPASGEGTADANSEATDQSEPDADAGPDPDASEVRVTYTMRPKFIPGAPSRVVLVPEGRTGITRPEVFSESDAQKIAPKVVALSRSILGWSPTLDETQTENLIDGALFAVSPPATLDGVSFEGFGRTDGEAGNAGFVMPAECASLFRSFTERAELLKNREIVAARTERDKILLAEERKRGGLWGEIWDSERADRLERRIERDERILGNIDRAIAEETTQIKRREETLTEDEHRQEIAEIKADPERLAVEEARRRQAVIDAAREVNLYKWKKIEGEKSYVKQLAGFDAMIENAEERGLDELADALRADKGRLESARDSWRERMDAIHDNRVRDYSRELTQNARDGIGPEGDITTTLLSEGKDPIEILEGGLREQAGSARRQAERDAVTLGGESTREYTFEDFAADLAEDQDNIIADPMLFVNRYGKFMQGAGEGVFDAVKDLAVLAIEAGDTAGEAFESGLSDVTGIEFNTFGRENLDTIVMAGDFIADADALKIGEMASGLAAAADRRLERLAGQGERGVEEALRGAGYATATILSAEEAVIAGVLKGASTVRQIARAADAASDIATTARVADAAGDVATAARVADTAEDAATAARVADAVETPTPDLTPTTTTPDVTPTPEVTPTPDVTPLPDTSPDIVPATIGDAPTVRDGPDTATPDTPSTTPESSAGMADALQPNTKADTPDVTPTTAADTPTVRDTPETTNSRTPDSSPDAPADTPDVPKVNDAPDTTPTTRPDNTPSTTPDTPTVKNTPETTTTTPRSETPNTTATPETSTPRTPERSNPSTTRATETATPTPKVETTTPANRTPTDTPTTTPTPDTPITTRSPDTPTTTPDVSRTPTTPKTTTPTRTPKTPTRTTESTPSNAPDTPRAETPDTTPTPRSEPTPSSNTSPVETRPTPETIPTPDATPSNTTPRPEPSATSNSPTPRDTPSADSPTPRTTPNEPSAVPDATPTPTTTRTPDADIIRLRPSKEAAPLADGAFATVLRIDKAGIDEFNKLPINEAEDLAKYVQDVRSRAARGGVDQLDAVDQSILAYADELTEQARVADRAWRNAPPPSKLPSDAKLAPGEGADAARKALDEVNARLERAQLQVRMAGADTPAARSTRQALKGSADDLAFRQDVLEGISRQMDAETLVQTKLDRALARSDIATNSSSQKYADSLVDSVRAERAAILEKGRPVSAQDVDWLSGARGQLTDLEKTRAANVLLENKNQWLKLLSNPDVGPAQMHQLTVWRKAEVDNMLQDVIGRASADLKRRGIDDIPEPLAFGSNNLTSDYDLSIKVASGPGSADVVRQFNREFRKRFGAESGTVFDTNVYTQPSYDYVSAADTTRRGSVALDARQSDRLQQAIGRETKVRRYANDAEWAAHKELTLSALSPDERKIFNYILDEAQSNFTNAENVINEGAALAARNPQFQDLAKRRKNAADSGDTTTVAALDEEMKALNNNYKLEVSNERYADILEEIDDNMVALGRLQDLSLDEGGAAIRAVADDLPNMAKADLDAFQNNLAEAVALSDEAKRVLAAGEEGAASKALILNAEAEQALEVAASRLATTARNRQGEALYYAAEAYFTQGAIKHVVDELQAAGRKITVDSLNSAPVPTSTTRGQYLDSFYENRGDLFKEMRHLRNKDGTFEDPAKAAAKVSKYFIRQLDAGLQSGMDLSKLPDPRLIEATVAVNAVRGDFAKVTDALADLGLTPGEFADMALAGSDALTAQAVLNSVVRTSAKEFGDAGRLPRVELLPD
ncbi:MAG: hypothetical protein JKY41_00680 [Rhodobacteraceae bacterium]|nr:hypothetical protein [Paracoccaceae bacterium]